MQLTGCTVVCLHHLGLVEIAIDSLQTVSICIHAIAGVLSGFRD